MQKKQQSDKNTQKLPKNISPDKSVSISSSLNSIPQVKPKRGYQTSSSSHSAKKTRIMLNDP